MDIILDPESLNQPNVTQIGPRNYQDLFTFLDAISSLRNRLASLLQDAQPGPKAKQVNVA